MKKLDIKIFFYHHSKFYFDLDLEEGNYANTHFLVAGGEEGGEGGEVTPGPIAGPGPC